MEKKQSSFNMGYEFNSYGDKVYIKADTSLAPQISQKNVQLTPDYSSYALKVEGGNAAVLNPENVDIQAMTMLGSQASVNNISLTKNEVGVYNVDFKVATSGLTDNPTKTSKGKDESKIHYVWYFVVTGTTNLSIRSTRSTKADNIVAKVPPGGPIKVGYNGDYAVSESTEDDSEPYNWVKVKGISDIKDKQNWKEDEEKDGWVPRIYVREDIKKTISMKRYDCIFIGFQRVNETTTRNASGSACTTWYSFATSNLQSTDVCPQTNGRWHVQVGPAVLDWEYPTNGTVGGKEEFTGFTKYIDVYLNVIKADKNKIQNRVLKCVVTNLKAHTFCYYPYDEYDKDYTRYEAPHFKSNYVVHALADVCPGVIDPGIVQTGIRYPNAYNESVVKESAMDFSVVEFYGGPNTNFGFTLSDYVLEKIIVNDDTITPNLRGKKMGITK